uniref:Major facilitator superfamily (MFS) profile domain-containing protein n=1 Tax=Fagus sylvatica TaxID=28930 RepID=A0A2N9H0J3_FAGSY
MQDTKISNYCKFDSQLLTSFTSSLYIAGLVASLFASSVTKAFGRKSSILVGGIAFLVGSALAGAALNVSMLIFGRILLGIGVGFANQSIPLYLSEMAPPNHRGATNIGFDLCVRIGVLSANLINFGSEKIKGGWGWRISLAMSAVPASILTLGAVFLPETPNSLIQNNEDHEKAKLMLQRVRGTNDVQEELDDLIKANAISKTIKHPFKNIIQRKYRPQLVMAIAIPFFQQVTGINFITFYAPVLFRTIGFGESASLLSSILITGVSRCSSHKLLLADLWQLSLEIKVGLAKGAQTFFTLLCHFKYRIFFFFGGWVVVMSSFVYFLLPETKNVPIEQMNRVWSEHWFWKRIVGEVNDDIKVEAP